MIRKILSAIEPNRVKYEKLFQYRFKIDAFAGYWLQHLLRGDVFSKLDPAPSGSKTKCRFAGKRMRRTAGMMAARVPTKLRQSSHAVGSRGNFVGAARWHREHG